MPKRSSDAGERQTAGSGVRRAHFSGLPEARARLTEGTYYLGVSQGPLHLSEPAGQDDIDYDDTLDFRGAAVSGRRDTGASFLLNVQPGVAVPGTFTAPFEILWYRLDVGAGQNTSAFCPGDGSAGACACGPSAAGQGAGCVNSTGRGARLFAHGTLEWHSVFYELEDLPPGSLAIVFAALSAAPGQPSFGGNLCLDPGAIRLDPVQASAIGRARSRSGTPFFTAGYLAGTTVYAQAAYRDATAAPGCEVNLTNGEALTVRP